MRQFESGQEGSRRLGMFLANRIPQCNTPKHSRDGFWGGVSFWGGKFLCISPWRNAIVHELFGADFHGDVYSYSSFQAAPIDDMMAGDELMVLEI